MAGELKLNNVSVATESGGVVSLSAANTLAFPSGHIIQVQSSTKTDTTETRAGVSASGFVDITGTDQNGSGSVFCVKITPQFSTSKILVLASLNVGGDGTTNFVYLKLFRDNTGIFIGDSAGSRVPASAMTLAHFENTGSLDMVSYQFLDSPTIPSTPAEITYKVKFTCGLANDNVGYASINASRRDQAASYYDMRGASTITAMEISQ